MSKFLMKPKIDFAFKEIMTDEKARVGFLSAVLKLNPKDIKKTTILNTNLRKIHKKDKQGILDVRILMNDDTEIDIEIQLVELKVWADRSLFYISKMYVDQIQAGQDYAKFKKCVSISILNFNLFPDNLKNKQNISDKDKILDDEFYSCFHIREDNHHFLYTDKMEFHVIELPKLPKELKENSTDILLWAKFINAEREEEFQMLASKNTYIDSAYERLQIISQDKQKQMEYEARQKAILDHNQMVLEATEKGMKQGIEQGMKQGIKQGIEQGIEKGMKQGIEQGFEQGIEHVAKNLINEGYPIDAIAQLTGISIDIIEKMQKNS